MCSVGRWNCCGGIALILCAALAKKMQIAGRRESGVDNNLKKALLWRVVLVSDLVGYMGPASP